ncbi:MAG: enoyl-CoA hydratase family protein [Deltaproteobacteria bacterium]|nr:enoyl-CoA hydratase family protein [Deltaproteobacteria bacterium]MBK8237017.1 enoyl-CoA hydratase family protein [Deltaproteobacteria bacterium]MBK8720528.1 enoyl-CoA hydratase family protein [Deltaproteobacteria bacterium]MBP7286425.1 enoyl-CoA hydratase family protein [Nannocystaceae bacterium]
MPHDPPSSPPQPQHFHYEERDRVGIITLDRPDRYNALTFAVYRELTDFFASVDRRASAPEGARALVLQGRGKAFCSGGDVEDIIGHLFARDTEGLLAFTRMTGELIANMRRCRLPIVASVKRVAAGAGAVMALASDLRVMGRHAFFAFLFPQVGLSGADMGASWLLPRVVGLGHASEILMLGERVPAERCEQIGLATRVVDDDDPALVDAAAFALASKLAAGPHFALRMTKQMLGGELELPLAAAIEAEAQAQAICMQHPDFREAHEAWKAGRPPGWR